MVLETVNLGRLENYEVAPEKKTIILVAPWCLCWIWLPFGFEDISNKIPENRLFDSATGLLINN